MQQLQLKWDKKLKKFLRDKKVLTKFRLNFNNGNIKFTGIFHVNAIDSSFAWRFTPEGHKFWSALSDEFNKLK